MDVTLPFWVIMHSGRWNVMNPTMGGPYLVVGWGELFYRESYCDERVIMTIYVYVFLLVFLCFVCLRSVLCSQCFLCLWIIHSRLSLRVSLAFNNIDVPHDIRYYKWIKGDNTEILKFETRCATLWIEPCEPKVPSNPFDALPVLKL
jgi:hypothetical protein